MYRRTLAIGLVVVSLLMGSLPSRAAPDLQGRAVITYPANGMTLSGVVNITGIATHPNLNFYQLRYAAGSTVTADSRWVDFVFVQATQVDNNVLVSWDTAALPNGPYVLALAVWGQDDSSSPYVFFVEYLTVDNSQLPTPTPETATPTPEQLATAAIGPTPTPVPIEQPATPTPRPTPTPAGGAEAGVVTPTSSVETGGLRVPVSAGQLREAFLSGGAIAVLLLLLWGSYLLLKAVVRLLLRRFGRPR